MAKRRKSPPAPIATSGRTTAPKPPPVEQPAFWFGFEVAWAKLVVGRVVLFGLLAVDALLQIRHAPRYGAGGFNVAQVAGLDALGPTRTLYGIAELINGYLLTLAACGVATRLVLPVATAIYAWLYFGSQLDSYQHHYLVALVLLAACFVPWQRPAGATPSTPVRTWALRLVLVQLAIMYLWAAISKVNTAWLDGTTLGEQITGPLRSLIDATLGIRNASKLVVVGELALAATVWNRRTWRYAAPLGLAFHVGILFSGLEIGLFAWLMIGIYVFVVPDRVWTWLADTPPARAVRDVVRRIAVPGGAQRIAWLGGVVLGTALAFACRFEHARAVAIVLAAAFVVGSVRRASLAWLGAAHLFALATWLVVDRTSTVAIDYYRFWGGTSRRLGDSAAAERAYRELIAVAPDEGSAHYQLGKLLLARDAADDGLAELHDAERLEPQLARAFVLEARWLATHQRRPEALAKARAAAIAEPADPDAHKLVEALERSP